MIDHCVLSPAQIVKGLSTGDIKVVVVGLGYVGLPLALLLANKGARVIGIDKRKSVVDSLLKGILPIYEPGLKELLEKVDNRNLHVTSDLAEAVTNGDMIVICVGTPVDKDGRPLLKDLNGVAESIGRALDPGKAVIVRSTVPPGTTDNTIRPRLEKPRHLLAGRDFAMAYCPERLVEGSALAEIENVPHIVGANDEASFRAAEGLFSFVGGEILRAPTIATAEMAKLFDNVYRAANIALANELAVICEALRVDVIEAIKVANTGPRTRILMPGCGVGGSCLTKDPLMLSYMARKKDVLPKLIAAVQHRNRYMPLHMIDLVKSAFEEMGKKITGARISIMGLAFKGETDDVRQSVAIHVVKTLSRMNARIVGYDPYVSEENTLRVFGKLMIQRDPFAAAKQSDCLVITADHKQLREINLSQLAACVNKPAALVDGRNVFDSTSVVKAGFIFKGVGRIPVVG